MKKITHEQFIEAMSIVKEYGDQIAYDASKLAYKTRFLMELGDNPKSNLVFKSDEDEPNLKYLMHNESLFRRVSAERLDYIIKMRGLDIEVRKMTYADFEKFRISDIARMPGIGTMGLINIIKYLTKIGVCLGDDV